MARPGLAGRGLAGLGKNTGTKGPEQFEGRHLMNNRKQQCVIRYRSASPDVRPRYFTWMVRTLNGKPRRVPGSTSNPNEAYRFPTIQHAIDVRALSANPFECAGIAEIVRLTELTPV